MSRTMVGEPVGSYRYAVTILPGLPDADGNDGKFNALGFSQVSGLAMEREETQYNEGGYSYTTKLPGRERADDVTFRKGIANNDTNQAMLRWFQMISPEIGGSTANYSKFRKQILVVLQDRFGSVVNSWLLEEAWIKRYEAPELDGSSTEVAVEAMVVACEYIHTQM